MAFMQSYSKIWNGLKQFLYNNPDTFKKKDILKIRDKIFDIFTASEKFANFSPDIVNRTTRKIVGCSIVLNDNWDTWVAWVLNLKPDEWIYNPDYNLIKVMEYVNTNFLKI